MAPVSKRQESLALNLLVACLEPVAGVDVGGLGAARRAQPEERVDRLAAAVDAVDDLGRDGAPGERCDVAAWEG